jgi:hypothetical protein
MRITNAHDHIMKPGSGRGKGASGNKYVTGLTPRYIAGSEGGSAVVVRPAAVGPRLRRTSAV